MSVIVDRLASALNVRTALVRQLLSKLSQERRGVLVDVGGLRGSRRPAQGAVPARLVIERYIVLDNPPPVGELLK